MSGDEVMDDYTAITRLYRYDIDVGLELVRLMLLDGSEMVAKGHIKTAMRHLSALKMMCDEILLLGDEQ
tara:strand:+ start:520 stop:726 length:207 start_codon:yes stop_codon:yes gene_type:complete